MAIVKNSVSGGLGGLKKKIQFQGMLTKMELLNLGGIICNMLQTERSQIHEHPDPGASPFPELGETTHRSVDAGCPCSWAPHTLGNLETADQQKHPYEQHHSKTSSCL